MIRGTTPTLQFVLPFETINIKKLFITFSQDNKEVFTLDESRCSLSNELVTVTLTQQETLMFTSNQTVRIQLRVLTVDDSALASSIITTSVQKILKEGEI